MKKYKVIALSVGGLGNKVFSAGDEVNESNFPEGRAEVLVKQSFLEPLSDSSDSSIELSEEDKELFELLSIEDLKEELTKKEIKFNKRANKIELFNLFKAIPKE